MINIRKYQTGDIAKIDPVPGAFDMYAKHDLSLMIDGQSEYSKLNVFTVAKQDHILAVIIWYFMWDGVVELLALTDKSVKKSPIQFAKIMKKWMGETIQTHKIRRIQTTLRATFPEGQKWLSFLGMEQEGLMREFCPDRVDCQIWARVGE